MTIKTLRIGPSPKIAIDYDGSGDLVIFLHGVGGNRSNWTEQVAAFSERYLAVAWDARGYGESEDFAGPFDFADACDDLVRVLDHFGSARAHVVGLSMGGLIAQEFWRQKRGRIASLTLCDTLARPSEGLSESQRAEFLRLRQAPLLAGREPADIAPTVARSLASPMASSSVVTRLTGSIAALHKETYLKAIEAVINWDGIDLTSVAVPTLVLVGDLDQLTPRKISEHIAGQIEGARLDVIAGAGHLSNIEKPAEFNAAVAKFLDQVRRQSAASTAGS